MQRVAEECAAVTHNNPEGIKGAVVTATCIWMAKHGKSQQDIYDYVLEQYPEDKYPFSIAKDLEYIRRNYDWDVSCQGSVPVAMRCFYESDSYDSFIRNVFSFDCDCDTICCIGDGVAFVAMTRAKKRLFISEAGGITYEEIPRYPSRFILDIDKEMIEYTEKPDEALIKAARRYCENQSRHPKVAAKLDLLKRVRGLNMLYSESERLLISIRTKRVILFSLTIWKLRDRLQ